MECSWRCRDTGTECRSQWSNSQAGGRFLTPVWIWADFKILVPRAMAALQACTPYKTSERPDMRLLSLYISMDLAAPDAAAALCTQHPAQQHSEYTFLYRLLALG